MRRWSCSRSPWLSCRRGALAYDGILVVVAGLQDDRARDLQQLVTDVSGVECRVVSWERGDDIEETRDAERGVEIVGRALGELVSHTEATRR